ncbi:MAG: DUF6240 domain-containing protein [Lachnospiraceae bacterium]|nr:DUF6240 domain-containing protein [Lachnospiraceae bacterium]
MQIEDLLLKNSSDKKTGMAAELLSDTKNTDETVGTTGTGLDGARVKVEKGDKVFRAPVYNKKEIRTAAQAYEKQAKAGSSEKNIKDQMILAAHTMSKKDYKAMMENGFDPADTDSKTFVTIADKIRISMAKAGKDMSITGKVKRAAVEAVSGSSAEANGIEEALKKTSGDSALQAVPKQSQAADVNAAVDRTLESLSKEDLPVSSSTASEVREAASMISQLPDTISAESSIYLIKNELDPTLDNVIRAAYAGNTDLSYDASISDSDIKELLPQISGIIEGAGLLADGPQIDNAVLLLKNGVDLTSENIKLFNDLNGKKTMDQGDLPCAVTDTVKEGKRISELMAVSGFSAMDKARDAMQTINAADPDDASRIVLSGKTLTIANLKASMTAGSEEQPLASGQDAALKVVTAQRQLEETRLLMTTEANFDLIKRGVSIDTTALSDLVEKLKERERSLGEILFPDDDKAAQIFDYTTEAVGQAGNAPAALISSFKRYDDIFSETLTDLSDKATGITGLSRYIKAEKLYQKLSTLPDQMYGDTVEKAFSDIDQILEDNGLEASLNNRRAVRILVYNNREVNADSIEQVRTADEKVQRVFGNMTPGVVMKMVKHGENPLQMSMDELYDKTEQIKKVMASSGSQADKDAEDFAEFLWKAEQSGKVTDEESQSFIGLYRLMHQIDETDGAPIGALLAQGADITMQNLMMAVRSEKYAGHDYVIDDSFEAPNSHITNSITDQIGAAYRSRWAQILSDRERNQVEYQTMRTRDAKALMTPDRLSAIGGEEAYLPMSPDELASALEAEGPEEENTEYQQRQAEIEQALTETGQDSYRLISDAGIPDSPLNLAAINQMLSSHRLFYTRLYGENGRKTQGLLSQSMADGEQMTLDDGWEKLIEDFSEAMDSPEELARAEKELYDTAENVLRKSLADDASAGRIDIRLIQQSVRQLSMMKELSEKKEEYAIPVMVGDELGNMNVRIVRGSDEKKGLIDLAMDSDTTGEVYARFKTTEDGGIEGRIRTDRRESRETLSENLGSLAARIQEKLKGTRVSLVAEYDRGVNAAAVLTNTDDPGFETSDERTSRVQTKTLYSVARSFVETVGELF